MNEWEVITIEANSGVWTFESAEEVAELLDGTATMASQLGITSVTMYGLTVYTAEEDVPMVTFEGCEWALVGWNVASPWYNSNPFTLQTLETESSMVIGIGWSSSSVIGSWGVLKTDDFVALKRLSGNAACFVLDNNIEDLLSGEIIRGFILQSGQIYDITNSIVSQLAGSHFSNTIVQQDGTAYLEVINCISYQFDSGGYCLRVYRSNNIYTYLYDYDSHEKSVEINGITMHRMCGQNLYVPME